MFLLYILNICCIDNNKSLSFGWRIYTHRQYGLVFRHILSFPLLLFFPKSQHRWHIKQLCCHNKFEFFHIIDDCSSSSFDSGNSLMRAFRSLLTGPSKGVAVPSNVWNTVFLRCFSLKVNVKHPHTLHKSFTFLSCVSLLCAMIADTKIKWHKLTHLHRISRSEKILAHWITRLMKSYLERCPLCA